MCNSWVLHLHRDYGVPLDGSITSKFCHWAGCAKWTNPSTNPLSNLCAPPEMLRNEAVHRMSFLRSELTRSRSTACSRTHLRRLTSRIIFQSAYLVRTCCSCSGAAIGISWIYTCGAGGILTPQPAICTDWQTKPPILAREFMLLFLPVRSSSSFPIAYRLCWLSHSAIDKCTADWLACEWQLYGRIFPKYNFT